MKPLSEMLRDAHADAPRTRYDVDAVVAAGRRRLRRRNSGWAVAAVVAVVAAIGVPQVVTRAPVRQTSPQPAQSAQRVVVPTPARGGPIPLVTRFAGYRTAAFEVKDPTSVGLGYTSAIVERRGPRTNRNELSGADLRVYDPGVDPLADRNAATKVEADPVKGRRAFFLGSGRSGPSAEAPSLVWEYADDGALAVLTPGPYGMKRGELREVAEAFTMTAARPVMVAFKLGYVPREYRLDSITSTGSYWSMGLQPVEEAREQLRTGASRASGIVVWLDRLPDTSGGMRCGPDGCPGKVVAGGRYRFEIGTGLPAAEVTKIISGAVVFSVDDPATWLPVNQAVPEANQLRVE